MLTQSDGTADDDESTATIHTALDLGIDFFDTSDITWGAPRRAAVRRR